MNIIKTMLYRTIHKANERYMLAIMVLLIVAFLVTMALMFVHPTIAILMFWLGLIILAVATLVEKIIAGIERATARRELRKHACPECGLEVFRDADHQDEWHCHACGASFLDNGIEQPHHELEA